jgi:hypothetical protein
LIREQFGTSTSLYHRRHYNSRGQLFDMRLGADGAAANDGPNLAQWTVASWNSGALWMLFSCNIIEYLYDCARCESRRDYNVRPNPILKANLFSGASSDAGGGLICAFGL